MLSLSTKYYQILLTQGLLSGLACGLLYIPSVALIPLYFRHRRGLALGCALAGAPLGGIIYPIVFRALLNNPSAGFGWATRAIALISLLTLGSAALLLHPMKQLQRSGRDFFEWAALREVPFTAFVCAAFLIYCAWLVPYFLTPAFALSLGASADTSFYLLAVVNAGQLVGRLGPAFLSDYVGGEWMLLAAQVGSGILGLSWIAINSIGGFVEFQIFYGVVSGMTATLPAVVIPYVCPSLAVLGTRMGMVYASAGMGILVGCPVALAAIDPERGDFLGAQLWMGLCALVGASVYTIVAYAAAKQRKSVDKGKSDRPVLEKDLRAIFLRHR